MLSAARAECCIVAGLSAAGVVMFALTREVFPALWALAFAAYFEMARVFA